MFISTHEWSELANKDWDVNVCLFFVCFFIYLFMYIMYVCMHVLIHSLFLNVLYIFII